MKFRFLSTKQEVREVFDYHRATKSIVTLDTETTGLDPHKDKLLNIIVSGVTSNEAVMFAPEHVLELAYLSSHNKLILHNFKFDFHFLYQAGLDLEGKHIVYDTMLMHHLYDENKSHSLDSIVQELWADAYKEVFWGKYKSCEEAPLEDKLNYACRDVLYTKQIYDFLDNELFKQDIPYSLVEHVHELAFALYSTEKHGVQIDMPYLEKIGVELSTEIERLKKDIRATAAMACEAVELDEWAKKIASFKTEKRQALVEKPEINLDSPKQLASLLYDKLRLPVQRNKEKNLTTDDSALTALQNTHSIIPFLQKYRGSQKVYTAFIGGTLEKNHQGRIYPSFNVNGTVTGRISSSNPNMQQLPREGGIRGMYVPDEGHKLITCDYSQLEICLAAHFSNDPVLLELISSGKSMHDHTANALGIERQAAKTVNFLCIYGGTEFRLSQVLNISIREAKLILDKLWETYQGLKNAIDECHKKVEEGLPIVNPFGRHRRFDKNLQGMELQRAQRQGFNSLVQGTGADLTHWSFTQVAKEMRLRNIGKALFPVHDEIVCMPKNNSCKETEELLKYYMIHAGVKYKLKVPLNVDLSEPLERWEK